MKRIGYWFLLVLIGRIIQKILGFYNPLADNGKGKYEKSSILRLIELANLPENKDIPFFIILDEMNLSHVERYFADF